MKKSWVSWCVNVMEADEEEERGSKGEAERRDAGRRRIWLDVDIDASTLNGLVGAAYAVI